MREREKKREWERNKEREKVRYREMKQKLRGQWNVKRSPMVLCSYLWISHIHTHTHTHMHKTVTYEQPQCQIKYFSLSIVRQCHWKMLWIKLRPIGAPKYTRVYVCLSVRLSVCLLCTLGGRETDWGFCINCVRFFRSKIVIHERMDLMKKQI